MAVPTLFQSLIVGERSPGILMNSTTASETGELIRLARERGGEALGGLLETYRGYLSVLVRIHIDGRLEQKLDAEDLVQETFLQAHQSFDQFRGTTEGEFVEWLRRVLASKLANAIRRFGTQRRNVRRDRRLEVELNRSSRNLAQAFAGASSSPSQKASRREEAVLLADALGRLPPDYREIILLHHLRGLSLPEVAAHMGRTADAVEKLWLRALARLRRELGGKIDGRD